MKREVLLKEMKDMVGNKDPIEFFAKMVDVFDLLFNKLDAMEALLKKVKNNSALSINWDPKLASTMLTSQIDKLRLSRDIYENEIKLFKDAYTENKVTQSYDEFVNFWQDTLGFHPFLDYDA